MPISQHHGSSHPFTSPPFYSIRQLRLFLPFPSGRTSSFLYFYDNKFLLQRQRCFIRFMVFSFVSFSVFSIFLTSKSQIASIFAKMRHFQLRANRLPASFFMKHSRKKGAPTESSRCAFLSGKEGTIDLISYQPASYSCRNAPWRLLRPWRTARRPSPGRTASKRHTGSGPAGTAGSHRWAPWNPA